MKRIFKRIAIGLIGLIAVVVISILLLDWFLSRCSKQPDIAKQIEAVSTANLREHVAELSAIGSRFRRVKPSAGIKEGSAGSDLQIINQKLRPNGLILTDGGQRESKLNYLKTQLSSYGYDVFTHTTNLKKIPYQTINIGAEKLGSSHPETVLDITAHYDTFASSPGADDNNSGVAGLLETARLVAQQSELKRSIRFVFFDLEELGLIGSNAWLSGSSVEGRSFTQASANINLEMIGYYSNAEQSQKTPVRIPLMLDPPREGNFLAIIGNLKSYQLSQQLEGVYRVYAPDFPIFSLGKYGDLLADASRSDHSSYWEQGIPAVMVSDTANFRNPHYHQPTDTPEKLDYDRMTSAVRGIVAFAIDWAGRP